MNRSNFFKSLFGLALFKKPPAQKAGWRCLYCHEPWHEVVQVPPKEKEWVFTEGQLIDRFVPNFNSDHAVAFALHDTEPVLEFPGDDRCEFCGCAIRVKARG